MLDANIYIYIIYRANTMSHFLMKKNLKLIGFWNKILNHLQQINIVHLLKRSLILLNLISSISL